GMHGDLVDRGREPLDLLPQGLPEHGRGKWYYAPLFFAGSSMSIVTLLRGLVAALAVALAAGAGAADPSKVYRIAFGVAETSFDPARVSDLYSNTVNEAIFERLLTYDYLARPAKLVPLVAEAMPVVGDGGATYTFKLRKGIFFTPDPAFKGAKRELVAADFAYTIKRHA